MTKFQGWEQSSTYFPINKLICLKLKLILFDILQLFNTLGFFCCKFAAILMHEVFGEIWSNENAAQDNCLTLFPGLHLTWNLSQTLQGYDFRVLFLTQKISKS